LGKQGRFAAAVALTKTAQDIQRAIPAELDRVLDRPTEFTKRGTYVKAARRDTLAAEVGFKRIQASYMRYQIEGGLVQPRAGGIKLPGNIQLNAFGNIPRGTIARLKAAAKSGDLSSAIAKRLNVNGNRRKGAAPIQLFYGKPEGKGWEDAPVGIWRRVPPATPGGKGKLIPVIVFEDTAARYRRRFDFAGLAQRTVREKFAGHFSTAIQTAIRTAR
jgi:hypothetical protein